MKNIIIGLLVLISFAAIGQQTVPAIRGEINTYFPSSNAKTIQAVKLRETFNDVLDHVDTLNKKRFTKSIANIRLINNTNYELVYVTDSGKEGWFRYVSGSTATDDGTNTITAANGRRYVRESVLATSIADGIVLNAKLANAPANTLKGNNTGSSASVADLTASQVKALLSLDQVSNIPDAGKPISTATQTALNGKQSNIQFREEGSNVGISGEITTLNVTGMAATLSNSGSSTTLDIKHYETLVITASAEGGILTTGTAKATFRMPYAMFVQEVRASLVTAQTSGSLVTVDINEGGTSIISTKLTLDNTEKTTTTAAAAAVISDTSLADDAEITIDIDQVGDGTAKGLKITIKGYRL